MLVATLFLRDLDDFEGFDGAGGGLDGDAFAFLWSCVGVAGSAVRELDGAFLFLGVRPEAAVGITVEGIGEVPEVVESDG